MFLDCRTSYPKAFLFQHPEMEKNIKTIYRKEKLSILIIKCLYKLYHNYFAKGYQSKTELFIFYILISKSKTPLQGCKDSAFSYRRSKFVP